MTDGKTFNRWWVVFGAVLIQICLGAIYAWSVFRIPLQGILNISPTQASWPFSTVLIFFALATILGGRWQDKSGPRLVAIVGGVLLGLGLIGASYASSLTSIIIFYGVVSGIGIGLAYVCPVSCGVKWFPDKRGLITGLAVMGFGGGALIVGPLARWMIDTSNVFTTFRILGVIFLVLVFLGALILRNPPAGYKPAGWTPPAVAPTSRVDYSATQMLSTPQFYLVWLMYFFGCVSGLMIIGQTSPIAQNLGGYSKETAAIGVSVLAIFNAIGRVFWGRISDLIGRMRALFLMFLISGLMVLSYNLIAGVHVWFWFGISLVGLCFGGYLALFPAVTADFYGTKSIGANYGLVFTAYGAGGLLGPVFMPKMKEVTGNFTLAFVVVGVLCLVGAVMTFLVKAPKHEQ
jgi:OFA family oxalate/formate antiporter-like MFS transporter